MSFPPEAFAAILFAGRHLLPVLLLGLAAWLVGARLCRRVELAGRAEAAAVPLGLGLVAIGCALFLLGLGGQLHRTSVALLLAGAPLVARREVARLVRGAVAYVRELRAGGWQRLGPAVLVAAALVPVVALALYPPTGFDATLYHLPFVRAFAEAGGLVVVPELRFPVFPVLGELLLTVGWLAGGAVSAQAVALLPAAAATLAVAAWAGRAAGARAAWWAAALWLGNPLVAWMAGQAYVDLGLAAFTALGLLAWDRWRRGGGEGWLTLSAAFCGAAGAVKYHGLFFLALVGAAVAWRAWRERRPAPAVRFAGVSLLVAGPWYLRIALATGNPLFPYFQELLGGPAWHNRFDRTPAGWADGAPGEEVRLLAEVARWIATLPWTTTVDRAAFDFEAPLGPWPFLLLPAVALRVWRRDPDVTGAAAIAGLYTLAVALSPVRSVRFLLPAVAILAAAGAVAAVRLGPRKGSPARPDRPGSRSRPALVTAAGALVLAAPGLLYAPYKAVERGPLPLDPAARGDYLRRQVDGYGAVDWLDRRHGGAYSVYAFGGERLRAYAEGRFLGEVTGPYRHALAGAELGDPDELYRLLRRFGADHLLATRSALGAADPPAHPCFEPVYEDDEARVWALAPPGCLAAGPARAAGGAGRPDRPAPER